MIAREKVAHAESRAGIRLKQTHAKEGKLLRRRTGEYAHAKQYRRMRRVLTRQPTVLRIVLREVRRVLDRMSPVPSPHRDQLGSLMQRGERIRK
jgi:IS5 family transposase